MVNTQWERLRISDTLHKYLRGTYHVWSRIAESEHIFTVRMRGETPRSDDGGYYSIVSALKAKGLMT